MNATTKYIEVNKGYAVVRLDNVGDETLITVYNVNVKDIDVLIEKLQGVKADYAPKTNPLMMVSKEDLFPELAVNIGAVSLIDADEPPKPTITVSEDDYGNKFVGNPKPVDRSAPTTHYTCAETATFIREALKKAFPGQKFSVRSKVYSGGASINISWMDGVTEYEVNQVVQRFSGATFDGMIDLKSNVYYNDENGSNVSYGADYVFCNRHYSNGLTSQLAAQVANFEGIDLPEMNAWDWYDYSIQLRDGQLFTTRLSEARYCYSATEQKYIAGRFGYLPQWIECMIG